MDTSFFSARPSELLKIKIGSVLAQMRGGIHKSKVAGAGLDFKGFHLWAPGDNPSRINYPASLKRSPDLDDLIVNESYGEKRISVVVILDARRSMRTPPQKLRQAGDLFWLFAFSAFKELDRFRAMVVFNGGTVDSGWLMGEAKLEEFLSEEVLNDEPTKNSLESDNPIAILSGEGLKDTLLVAISDFCGGWTEELAELDYLAMDENSIRGTFIAVNEWADVDSCGYGVHAVDPLTGEIMLMDDRDFSRAAKAAEKFFSALAQALSAYPVFFTQVPLLHDSIEIFCESAFDLEVD